MKFTSFAVSALASSGLCWSSLFSAPSTVEATSIKMDFLPVGHVRTDPIITKTCLSDHIHTFYGAQVARPETDYQTLINTPIEKQTGNVAENKSLYWHPTIYEYDVDTDTYTRANVQMGSAYYIWDDEATFKVHAFPNGFRMIAGFDPVKAKAEAECSGSSPCRRGRSCTRPNNFFPMEACEELEASMTFPTCWNGALDSIDHMSHVAYTTNGELDGPCPTGYDKHLPQIMFFFRIINYSGGYHTFSSTSNFPNLFHADYMSGWDEVFLQNVIDNCKNDSQTSSPVHFCEQFLTFRDAPKCTDIEERECSFAAEITMEKLLAIQPVTPLDMKGTISPEETNILQGPLPMGQCIGELIPLNGPSPTSSPVSPTLPPVAPTSQPVQPTLPPVQPTLQPVQPTPQPVQPTISPITPTNPPAPTGGGGGGTSCESRCWERFDECEADLVEDCILFREECEDDCEGEEEEDEIEICKSDWCAEDEGLCFEKGGRRCFRRRNRCVGRCES